MWWLGDSMPKCLLAKGFEPAVKEGYDKRRRKANLKTDFVENPKICLYHGDSETEQRSSPNVCCFGVAHISETSFLIAVPLQLS